MQYGDRTEILLAFRICLHFKAVITNKVYRLFYVRVGRKCLRPIYFKLVISRLFDANVASKVTYEFILIEISYCNCILTLEGAKRPFCHRSDFTSKARISTFRPLASIVV